MNDANTFEHLLYGEAAAAVAVVSLWFMCPPLPKNPPSATAEEYLLEFQPGLLNGLKHYGQMMKKACSNRNFVLLALSGGVLTGVFNTWSGSLADILGDELGEDLSQWLGFVANTANFTGMMMIGPLTERFFAKRMLLLIIILYVAQMCG